MAKRNILRHEQGRWAAIMLFAASLFFVSSSNADIEVKVIDRSAHKQQKIEVKLISSKKLQPRVQIQVQPQPEPLSTYGLTKQTTINSSMANALFMMLHRHYKKQDSDPAYIVNDLKIMANYYSRFPKVISLLVALDQKNWQLSYDENNWVTTATGSRLHIEKATIHFNTRSAAQLRLNRGCKQNPICIASPADALLHELLHTHSMLDDSGEFIAQGGMTTVMYPYAHEYSIIDAERELYALMSRQDNIERPQRTDHTGQTVKAKCPTCIE